MDSSNTFFCAVGVKGEPGDASLSENDDEMIDDPLDLKNVKQENLMLPECNENRETKLDVMDIEFECKDVKLIINSSVLEKIDDNHENPCNSETQSMVRREITGRVKTEMNLNSDCELIEENEKRRVTKKLSNTNNRKRRIDSEPKGATCDSCGKLFKRKKSLIVHIDSLHNKNTYPCYVCGAKLKNKGYLKVHLDSVHSRVKNKCDLCGSTFSRKEYLKRHIKLNHEGAGYTCMSCLRIFETNKKLEIHTAAEHSVLSCNFCGKIYKKENFLQIHMKSHFNV